MRVLTEQGIAALFQDHNHAEYGQMTKELAPMCIPDRTDISEHGRAGEMA
ncbi:MAG: hypothetical protein ABIK83_04695 [Candidatus Zixiibacteriota bacterium]